VTPTSEHTVRDFSTEAFDLLPDEKILGDSRATHWHDPINILMGRLYSSNKRLIFSPNRAILSPWTTILRLRHKHIFEAAEIQAAGSAKAPMWFAIPSLFLISPWYIEIAGERHYFSLPLSRNRRVVELVSERYKLPIVEDRALWS